MKNRNLQIVEAVKNEPTDSRNSSTNHGAESLTHPTREIQKMKCTVLPEDFWVNVSSYAEENSLLLSDAHKEVQEFLFERGLELIGGVGKNVSNTGTKAVLVLTSEEDDKGISCESLEFILSHFSSIPEVRFKRTLSVTLSPFIVSSELVEIGGQEYTKQELATMITRLKSLEEQC